MYFWVGSKN